jgi:hypothetical protein
MENFSLPHAASSTARDRRHNIQHILIQYRVSGMRGRTPMSSVQIKA